ncbi:MAG: nuclear transport factor 2 family protein [Halieaceae bacterium]|jgi:ketosteroid isomerase-like protein|nr:nuclear transport factor 2 family protein [Halieaceae bacterium]MBT7313182.1 nuclear transport factor 2 family protein [Halieaceae bacterium]
MTDDEKLAIVAELYASTGAGDFDTAESLLTDDFFIIEAEGLPMAGEYRGKTALRGLYAHVFGTLKVADLEPEGMSVGGDYVVNLISFRFENPDLASAQLAEVFRFRGDKVCEIRPYYFDPKPIVDAWAYYSNAAD